MPTSDSAPDAAEFLNVDLDLHVAEGLNDLVAALEPELFVLNPEPQPTGFVSLGLAAGGTKTLEQTLVSMVEIVRGLPAEARAIWDACDLRRFDIGIQAGSTPGSAVFPLSQVSVAALASVGGEISITVYAPSGSARSAM